MTALKEIFRKDYQAPDFWVTDVYLKFMLQPNHTIVTTELKLVKNTDTASRNFILNGTESSKLLSLKINDQSIDLSDINYIDHHIHLKNLSHDELTITLSNELDPANNSALEGLYLSNKIFCSDCEPEGFRNITYFPDRPDIMAKYTVTIIADKDECPILLSNGNLIEAKDIGNNLHQAIWHDPFPKPSYLFALVAGDLGYIEDKHIRPDGTPVQLRIYAAHNEVDQCHYVLGALKRSMEWDEKRFGLVCDVDQYNIVAIHDFNGGAMENKGLNIFNAKYVLANSEIATDADFEVIESIIGHEYFHNWTGNRVTCRDWFQLSLKEGLTVFRDQEFTSDLRHRGLKRIDDVKMLRAHQFPEDAGRLKHPIRPESYVEMRNFYTTTVYEKGAEVVRLYQTLLGEEGFKKGLTHYLAKFDGTAATCDDFLASMSEANHADLSGFQYWYSQAGTPTVKVTKEIIDGVVKINFKQILTATGEDIHPQWIPIRFALINDEGVIVHEDLFTLKSWEDSVAIPYDGQNITLSLFRDFSAPVIVDYPYSEAELLNIIFFETDYFARWEAAQRYLSRLIASDEDLATKQEKFATLTENLLSSCRDEPDFYSLLMTLPEPLFIQSTTSEKDLAKILEQRTNLIKHAAKTYEKQWIEVYQSQIVGNAVARDLKNCALSYLAALPNHEVTISKQYELADNMTDRMAALRSAVLNNHSTATILLNNFLDRYKAYPSVIDKWFSLQASNPFVTLETLNILREHSEFNTHNPNRVRSLFSALGQNKVALFKQPEVFGAWLLDNIMIIDKINPQVAARLATPFSQLNFLNKDDQTAILNLIQQALTHELSTNLAEQLSKSL